jgi:hypothetical protein
MDTDKRGWFPNIGKSVAAKERIERKQGTAFGKIITGKIILEAKFPMVGTVAKLFAARLP